MTLLQNIRFLNAGYCSQFAFWTGLKSARWSKFHAVVVCFEHPIHGPHLIDTGYSQAFWSATRKLPFRAYRWLVPPKIDSNHCIESCMINQPFDMQSIKAVFLSHFHPDHTAGVVSLPRIPLIARHEPLAELLQLNRYKQMRHGFLPDLLPADRHHDFERVSESQFVPSNFPGSNFSGFRMFDYWGDGSLYLVDLPGHSVGHTGYVLNTATGPVFYIVDAAWNVDVLLQSRQLPKICRGLQYDYSQYWKTQQLLVELWQQTQTPLLACHCPKTQLHVSPPTA